MKLIIPYKTASMGAIENVHFDIIRYLHEYKLPMSEYSCQRAAIMVQQIIYLLLVQH
jgi:hypothetical protein